MKLASAELGKLSAELERKGGNPNEQQAVETVKGKVDALAALLGAIQTVQLDLQGQPESALPRGRKLGPALQHGADDGADVHADDLRGPSRLEMAGEPEAHLADQRPLAARGVLTFWAFTYHTYDRLGSQLKYRPLLPAKLNEKPATVHLDWASLVVPAVNLGVMMFLVSEGVSVPDPWRSLWTGFTVLGVLVPFGIWLKVKRSRLFSAENRLLALLALAGIVVAGVLAYHFVFAGFVVSCVVFPFAIWRRLRRGKRRSE